MQQAIEKCLKAIIAHSGLPIPRTHNLEDLGQAAIDAIPSLELDIDGLAEITPFAVELRYDPGFWPDRETAAEAFATARKVRSRAASVQRKLFRTADVLLTGAVLGRGSDALHQLVSVFTNFMESAAERAKGGRVDT